MSSCISCATWRRVSSFVCARSWTATRRASTRSRTCFRRPTGTSARPTTCSGSSSRAIPTSPGSSCPMTGSATLFAATTRWAARSSSFPRSTRRGGRRRRKREQRDRPGHHHRQDRRAGRLRRRAADDKFRPPSPVHPRRAPSHRRPRWRAGAPLKPVIGYLHTGIEKQAEALRWQQVVVVTDRHDYLSPPINNLAYALAVEKLLGLEVPPRADALRVIMSELTRLSSHLVWLGTSGI